MTAKKLLRQLYLERLCLGKVYLRNLDGSHVVKIDGTIQYGSVYFHTPDKDELISECKPDAVIQYASGTTLYLYKVDDYDEDNNEKTKD